MTYPACHDQQIYNVLVAFQSHGNTSLSLSLSHTACQVDTEMKSVSLTSEKQKRFMLAARCPVRVGASDGVGTAS